MLELLNFSASDIRGAIAGIFLTGLFTIIQKFPWLKRYFLAKNIWKPFMGKPRSSWVVLTTKASSRKSGTQKVSLSEVQAFSELENVLADLNINTELTKKPDVHLQDLQGRHIISIGGPRNNNITREILSAVENKYKIIPFQYEENKLHLIAGGKILESQEAADGTLLKDFGLIIRVTGLNNSPAISYLVAFALRGHGTWGTVSALTTDGKLMSSIDKAVGKNDFAVLLEFDFEKNSLVTTKILAANTLILSS